MMQIDESIFESLMNYLDHGCLLLAMDSVLPMCEVADHLQIEFIKSACQSFFYENFTAKQIPALIQHVRDDNSFLNLNFNKINSFLSRNFSRLINGEYFLEFPLEVVNYILSLDLCVETEYQVFQAIMKWINHDQSRGVHLEELMQCIRWCYTSKDCYLQIKENDFIVKNLPQLDELACESGECRNSCLNDRIKEKYLISLYFLEDNIIGMSYYTGDNCWEPCGSFEEDDQIPIAVISEEHVVDVIFDCGRTGLRIDLVSQKYRWLKMFESLHTYYNKLDDFFKPKFDIEGYLRPYIQGWPGEHVDWYNNSFADHRVHAIILKDVCYNITKSLTFCVFDMVKKTTEKSKPFDGMNLTFEDLQLDSHKSNVILLIKSQKKILMFDTRNKAWTLMGQIFSEYKMMTLTSTYIPVQFI